MGVEARRYHKKQREIYKITNHLSVPPSSTSDSDLLGAGINETVGDGHRLISSKTSSDACCAVFVIDTISLWEN